VTAQLVLSQPVLSQLVLSQLVLSRAQPARVPVVRAAAQDVKGLSRVLLRTTVPRPARSL
jgi:hypothetical protein